MALDRTRWPWPSTWQLRVLLLHLLFAFPFVVHPIDTPLPMANTTTTWANQPGVGIIVGFGNGATTRALLLRRLMSGSINGSVPTFGCGFLSRGTANGSLFVIFAAMLPQSDDPAGFWSPRYPHILWTANRDRPVGDNAALQLNGDGNLVLRDADGTEVWSTGSSGKHVAGMNLTEEGNLVLFDDGRMNRSSIVWQSFDHPTDTLVLGQKLWEGQNLTANASPTNSSEGGFCFSSSHKGLYAYLRSDRPLLYYRSRDYDDLDLGGQFYIQFVNGSLDLHQSFPSLRSSQVATSVLSLKPAASLYQYLKLESDGYMRLYDWSRGDDNSSLEDSFTKSIGGCGYPTVCGRYGICYNGVCSCPWVSDGDRNHFVPLDPVVPGAGCREINTLSCKNLRNHRLLRLERVTYFGTRFQDPDISQTDEGRCQDACLENCSCKAAFFKSTSNVPLGLGDCYLLTQVYSLLSTRGEDTGHTSTAFLKVQISASDRRQRILIILGSTLGALFCIFCIIITWVIVLKKKRARREKECGEDHVDQVPGMPRKFSLKELLVATHNFSRKLGQGGFGSVFGGALADGTRVAVKQLNGVGQGTKEFLAEVHTIGSIHHVNLVRLIGYCTESSSRLLVYEYMHNGSLEKWIFQRGKALSLPWQTRRNIILDVAKALSYLHDECRQRIIHLDIKPQNILLDIKFHAKVSDFGLSKLIDRDQSHVVTMMRGTPGYLAPEWLNYSITEKVDTYSFGVVVLEITCGRRNFEKSEEQSGASLVALLNIMIEENRLLDMVDENIKDRDLHAEEATGMLRIAAWCLQKDHTRRPSMSTVVKAIEGAADVESIQDDRTLVGSSESAQGDSTPLTASILSGPR